MIQMISGVMSIETSKGPSFQKKGAIVHPVEFPQRGHVVRAHPTTEGAVK